MRIITALVILFFFHPAMCFSQLKMNVKYSQSISNPLCSSSITLYQDSTFIFKRGCEGVYIYFGSWSINKDTLTFMPFDEETQAIIATVKSTKVPGDSLYVIILDKNDNNITKKVSTGLLAPNAGFSPFKLNKARTMWVGNKKQGGRLYLDELLQAFGPDFAHETGSENNFVVKLNVPAAAFQYPPKRWKTEVTFKLLIKGKTLVDPTSALGGLFVRH